MRRAGRGAAVALAALLGPVAALLSPAAARADFVRGSIKIDVRDGGGRPAEASVRVDGPSGPVKLQHVGEVWVAEGLVEGDYTVSAEGAAPQTVHVHGRSPRGVVFVLGGRRAGGFALTPRDHFCDDGDLVVEAVAFAHGGLAAGRLDVVKKGKTVCSAVVAGGEATLHLPPGDYEMLARFAGGGSARERYRLRADETPTPLRLEAR